MKKLMMFAAGLVAIFAVAMIPVVAQAGDCGCKGGPAMDGAGPHGGGMHKGHHGKHGDMKFWKCPKASAELALTEDQIKKLEAADAEVMKKMDAIKAEVMGLKKDLHEAIKAAKVDEKKVKDLAKKIAAKKASKFEMKILAKVEAFKVLTAEQKTKLIALHEKMMEKKAADKEGREFKCQCAAGDAKCDCGPDCKCGGDCQCGHDCKCGEGVGCQCGKDSGAKGEAGCGGGCGMGGGCAMHDKAEPAVFGEGQGHGGCGMHKGEPPVAEPAKEPVKEPVKEPAKGEKK